MGTLKITPDTAPATPYLPPADRILSGVPQQSIVDAYGSDDGKFSAGLWASTPGRWRVAYTEHEFCHLLEGEVVLHGDDGTVAPYRAGDSFVVPAGFTGTWEVVTAARKLYAIYQP
ncbi:transcriptional regulator [Aliidongia dinghuensis]|uniref:Transcriptional regulator n=1 Tax=Aliidongia dinghuensis TaxID=1867774 RepID=A0A8J3E124_9PROT|nr:cupin domain-containing protein [Aliidongia dinghuensis]GGF07320.1 transcriptional regulator [Aliidongia dinghuensis]